MRAINHINHILVVFFYKLFKFFSEKENWNLKMNYPLDIEVISKNKTD